MQISHRGQSKRKNQIWATNWIWASRLWVLIQPKWTQSAGVNACHGFPRVLVFVGCRKAGPLCHEIKVADPKRLRFDVHCGYFNHLSPSMTSHCWLCTPHMYPEPPGPFHPTLIRWWPCSAGTWTGVSPLLWLTWLLEWQCVFHND